VIHAAALFTEDFNAEVSTGRRHAQAQSELPIKVTGAVMRGWTRQGGGMPSHFVERAPGDWALMVVAKAAGQNTFTLNKGLAANDRDHIYFVAFDTSPAVYEALSQTTAAGDQLAVELIRADGTVLASHSVKPGKWEGKTVFASHAFSYTGDGSGLLRLRIFPVFTSGTRFYGAIDNLQVFGSAAGAEAALKQRVAAVRQAREAILKEKRELAQLLARCTPLERDWVFQAENRPTVKRARQEIAWARELADRLAKGAEKPDLHAELAQLGQLEAKLRDDAGRADAVAVTLYLSVRRVKRRIMMRNPVIDFGQLLLIDQPYPSRGGRNWRHEAIHRLGHRAVPGGRLLVLDGLDPDGRVRQLFPPTPGSFWRPDLSFDGQKVLFCFKPEDEKSFHLYEIDLDGSGLRQLTYGDYDDVDPIYLPDGHILFTTTRGNTYVRCGPYIYSYALARCDADGGNLYLISRNSEPDFVPALLNDGRVVYSRWEYSDKDQNRVQSLWTTMQDGTGTAVLWGNQSIWPDHLAEPRPIPGSERVMFAGVGHHNWFNGSIGIIDPRKGFNYPKGLTRVTWDLPWGEVRWGPGDRPESSEYHASGRYTGYLGAFPLSEEDFLVSARGPNDKYRIYLMDVHGNRELVYEGKHNAWYAIPVRPRTVPPQQPDTVSWPGTGKNHGPVKPGVFYSADVYQGVPELPRGSVKYLRVFQQDAKTYSTWRKTFVYSGPPVSAVQTEAVKRILSVVPVEPDGSVYFEAPAGKALFFQLLDGQYRALHTMRSFTGLMPGERRGCVGCHEMHSTTPSGESGLARQRPPPPVSPPSWGDESIGYERFVQPVLARHCGKCHQGDGNARKACDLTLRPATGIFTRHFKEPYLTLIGPAAWPKPVPGKDRPGYGLAGAFPVYGLKPDQVNPNDPATDDRSAIWRTMRPLQYLSLRSPLIARASSGKHHDVKVDPLSLRRLIAWVDANCPYNGEEEIRAMADPDFPGIEDLPVRPRLRTAPRIDRFNIRQDGDSNKICLNTVAVEASKQDTGGSAAAGHPFVICDIHKKQIMKVDANGKVVWTYPGERVHDLWVLPSGNILFAGPKTGVVEVTPGKKEVWTYRAGKGEAILSCQPLPDGRVMVGIQGKPSRIVEVGRDGALRKTIPLQTKGTIRLARKTHTETYLVAERKESSIHEYDGEGALIRRIASKGAVFMAARLRNGNTLIGTGTGHALVEVDPNDRIVWQVGENDLPGIPIRDAAGFQRLPNGNTVLCNWGGHGHIGKQAQIVEITPDKKVVWQVFDNEKFTTPLHIQLLDIKGDPARGELYR